MSRAQPLRAALICIAIAATCFIAAYAMQGPFDRPIRAHTPLNGILFAVVPCLLLLFLPREQRPEPPESGPIWPVIAVTSITVAVFLPSLSFPFVSDGCTHPWWARQQQGSAWSVLTGLLSSPQEGRFYRPVSFFSYFLNSSWAGLDPARWRLLNVLLHAANAALVFFVARRLDFSRHAALLAALLFGLHATRPEAVVWVGAHFEVLTTLFVFLSVLFWLRRMLALSLFTALLAFLSKESAFALPPLLTLIAVARRGPHPWHRAALSTAPWYCAALAVFAWRWHLLRGMGGYVDPQSGTLTILNFSPLHTAKALLLRIWTILGVPVNWSYRAEPWLAAAITAGLAALLWIAWHSRASRARLGLLAAAVVVAVLPSQHLALIGQGMDGSRILYIASAPFCLMLALAARSAAAGSRGFLTLAAALVTLQGAALAHNLRIWGDVATLAHTTVGETVRLIGMHKGPVGFRNVPNVLDGIYFIENGLPSCIAIQGGPPIDHLTMESPRTPVPEGALILRWDASARRMTRYTESVHGNFGR